VDDVKNTPLGQSSDWNCFCEVVQLTGDPRKACSNDESALPLDMNGNPVHGFCYVDATTSPPTGNPELTLACSATERRLLRIVGDGFSAPDATIQAVCVDEQCD
jgi:hypothetical protein